MTRLIVAILIAAIFAVLAYRNWKATIGAGPTILIVGALFLGGWWAYNYTADQSDRELAQIQATTAESNYRDDVDDFNGAVAAYAPCLEAAVTRNDTRNDLRDVLFDFANGVVDVLPASDLAMQFASDRIAYVNKKYPPLDITLLQDACPKPGPAPIDPTPGEPP